MILLPYGEQDRGGIVIGDAEDHLIELVTVYAKENEIHTEYEYGDDCIEPCGEATKRVNKPGTGKGHAGKAKQESGQYPDRSGGNIVAKTVSEHRKNRAGTSTGAGLFKKDPDQQQAEQLQRDCNVEPQLQVFAPVV